MKTSEIFKRVRSQVVSRKSTFICPVLCHFKDCKVITEKEWRATAAIIKERLEGCQSLDMWLQQKTGSYRSRKETEAHRIAWLGLLIEEFKSKGD
jgi:hypothetical protein